MRYTRLETIGKGKSGVVFKVKDHATDEIRAMKVLDPESGIPKLEVSLGQRIAHENVCRVYECMVDDDGSACILMEFVDGDLKSLMRKSGPLPYSEAMPLVWQILDGAEAIHRKGVVHRDLKPANIMVRNDGMVKISDFGLAREIGDAETGGESDDSEVGGTPPYASPEQWSGPADERSDIWAIGVVIFELLSGQHPDRRSLARLPSEVPAHVEAAIRRCLEMDPARRFGSIAALRQELKAPAHKRMHILAACVFLLVFTGLSALGLLNSPPESAGVVPLDDGQYFLRNNLPKDALERFDKALAMDPNSAPAHYYRGLALKELQRPDEALAALKNALPGSIPDRRVTWHWEAPFAKDSEYGLIVGMDSTDGAQAVPKKIIYGERRGKATVLWWVLNARLPFST